MKNTIWRRLGWVLPALLLAATALAGSIEWLDYDEALVEGARQDRPIMLYFYRNDCRVCTILEEKSLSKPQVEDYISENFAAARIHTKENRVLSNKYNISGVPTVWFLTPEGEKIDFFVGYIEPDRLLVILKYLGSGAYKEMSFEKFEKQNRG